MSEQSTYFKLVDHLGEEEALRFAMHLLLEERSFWEVVELMPESFPSVGSVAGMKRRYLEELKHLAGLYFIQYGPVQKIGRSVPFGTRKSSKKEQPVVQEAAVEIVEQSPKPRSERERDYAIAQGLAEWNPHTDSFPHPYAYAAMHFNKTRRPGEGAIKKDDVAERIRQIGGLLVFLRMVSTPKVDRVVERIGERLAKLRREHKD